MQDIMAEKVARVFTVMKLRLFLLIFTVSIASCENESTSQIPEVFLDVTLRLDLPQFDELLFDGGWVYLDQANGNVAGFRGLIVYRVINGEYRAFDRACSYKPLEACHILEADISGAFISCSCGESKYGFDGNVINAPASLPLKMYSTLYSPSNNSLRVFNNR